jgi:HPt (histidine-containing phosphotransfer) domain-containing protein
MGSADRASIAEAMNRLWAQYLPQIEERVQILEQAGAAHRAGSMTSALCEQAASAAHKLAGVLGTFGLPEGTQLAREAETLYASDAAPASGRPAEIAARLRALLATRK